MKLIPRLTVLAALLVGINAQTAQIGAPPPGTHVRPGSSLVVEVDRPDSLTGSIEVAVVIGCVSCAGRPSCPAPSDITGSILYNGPFNPQFQQGTLGKPPHQNFTVTIPQNIQKGPAQLNLVHATLIGAGLFPFLETRNISLVVV
ncbi:hypothetical protein MIND_00593000 [Mycena indigotica]|uniref:Uncharacterized protein n=1 Tax=Mycena indigotica TaxID=2126181 RepID=A0A8H6SRM4_9AGAR|nr:uncharacterized protein MIND_00593000 [Mycena indigotica]KAF7303637.1 hypothetical protein MIND_00593000 [Mycena indigotica]